MNVALIGMPGSGKTETGRVLAGRLGARFMDTDEEIERAHGPVEDLFAGRGEAVFREIELRTIERLFPADGVVVSTGGGCVVTPGCVRVLKDNCTVVYLRAEADTLAGNITRSGRRPGPLLSGDIGEGVERLLLERSRLYEAAADLTVDTAGMTPGDAAEAVLALLEDER